MIWFGLYILIGFLGACGNLIYETYQNKYDQYEPFIEHGVMFGHFVAILVMWPIVLVFCLVVIVGKIMLYGAGAIAEWLHRRLSGD